MKQSITLPPGCIVKKLYELAMNGDVESIVEELEQLEQADSQFAHFVDELRLLAEEFQVCELGERLEYYLTQVTS